MDVSTKKLDYRELSSYKALFLDYLYDFDRLASFFAGDPRKSSAWVETAGLVDRYARDRARLANLLGQLNRSLGADEQAMGTIDAIHKGALAIVTGQQVGLFGGPLYTLYKAMTAAVIARSASSQLGRAVVPLFWMDADDHDFDEIRHVRLVDASHQLVTVSYDVNGKPERLPVARLRLERSVEEMLEKTDASLPTSEFKRDVLDSLREAYSVGTSLTRAFGQWLLRMTRGTGLAVVDPTMPELKALAAPLFEREASERSESTRLVQETTDALVAQGYHAQATTTEDALNLFYAAPERFHILSEDSGFRIAADGRLLPLKELRTLIHEEPEQFSPNVLLRPLFQDALLPTLAYIAGPNELAYFAQLKAVYRHFELPMPLVFPRASFTVVERSQAKFMQRYGVQLTDLRANDESTLNQILKQQAPPQLEEDLARARSCVREILQALERDLRAVDPTLVSTVKSARGKLLHQIDHLEKKSFRAIKRKDDTLRRQFFSARTALFPDFDMQERCLSPVQYLAKYGWFFSELVSQSIDVDAPAHVLLYP